MQHSPLSIPSKADMPSQVLIHSREGAQFWLGINAQCFQHVLTDALIMVKYGLAFCSCM